MSLHWLISTQKGRCSSTALISNLHSSLEIQKYFGPSPHNTNHLSMTPIQGKLKVEDALPQADDSPRVCQTPPV